MDIKNCYCVIMAGGVGKRFWPLSRTTVPKQFLDVADTGETFIRKTYNRFLKIVPEENILIVTADRYKDLVKEQIREISDDNLLLEPYSRNTAPCIAYATYTLLKRNPHAHIIVTPSDHLIGNEDIFTETILNAFRYVSDHDSDDPRCCTDKTGHQLRLHPGLRWKGCIQKPGAYAGKDIYRKT